MGFDALPRNRLVKRNVRFIEKTDKPNPVVSNKLQELALAFDENQRRLRIQLQKLGETGQDLPYYPQQSWSKVTD